MVYPAVSANSAPVAARKPVSLPRLAAMHAAGEPIAMLTCYDASFATLLDRAGVDIILIGDSLGNVIQGEVSTLPVTLEHIVYHTECVLRGLRRAGGTTWVMADLPYGSYHESNAQAYASCARLMRAGAHMVKIEGVAENNAWVIDTIRFLSERGIPVCAHVGLTPQSVHQLGGYRVQGKDDASAARLLADAHAMQQAGARLLLMEMVPGPLATQLTQELSIPTIGIGAGNGCSGQVLVLHDMLGVFPGKPARFVKNFMNGAPDIETAVRNYVSEVKSRTFPGDEHTYA